MSYLVEKNLLYKIGTSAREKSKTSVRKNSPRKNIELETHSLF